MVGFPYTQNCTCNDWYIVCLIGRNAWKTAEFNPNVEEHSIGMSVAMCISYLYMQLYLQSIVMSQLVPGRNVPIQELVAGCSATTAMSGTTVCVKEHPTVM